MTAESVFSGLKVLDIASYIAAPAATTILGDLGADVIKVEPPGLGDLQRYLGLTPPNPRAKANYSWHMTNRNKRGIVIDLKSAGGTRILERLVAWADVLVTNYPPEARQKLHLGFDEVSGWNPHLIYADITGFGDQGPDAALPGFDITAYWARTGLLATTRDAGAPPTVPVQGSGDYATAIALYGAIVTGLYLRERTGSGVHVGTSLLAAGAWATATLISGALAGGEFYGLHDRNDPPNPLISPYQSSDGTWFMLVCAPPYWKVLAQVIGHGELLDDPRFANPRDFGAAAGELATLLDAKFRSKPLEEWKKVLDEARITYGLIQTPQEAAQDPQFRANEIYVPIDGVGDGLELTVGSPVSVYGSPKRPAYRAPAPGEHTEEILAELGFTPDAVDDLRTNGAIPTKSKTEVTS